MSCHPDLKQYAFCGFNLLSWIGSGLRSRVPSVMPSAAPLCQPQGEDPEQARLSVDGSREPVRERPR